MRCETSKCQFSASGTQKHAFWGTLRWKTLPTPSQKQLDGIWEHRLVCQGVCLVESLTEEFSLTMSWMNADTDYDSVTISAPFKKKHIRALKRMCPKASIKETTRTLTFNCFFPLSECTTYIGYMCFKFWSRSRNRPRPILSHTLRNHQPRMWKSPSDPNSCKAWFQQVSASAGGSQVKQKTSTKGKALNNRTHKMREGRCGISMRVTVK